MESKKRFKIGDTVTFKFKNDCNTKKNYLGYYYSGDCQGGVKAKIIEHVEYISFKKIWRIDVSFFDKENKENNTYTMLESEFLEFNNQIEDYEIF
jgi:Uri superfamily endonuclease